nr:ribonuclease H-like domain-containing protein [Tanacetum cinerariifolium]
KPPSSSRPKLYLVTPFLKSKGLFKIDESYALSKPDTSNSVPSPQEPKVMKNDKVITLGMFRINNFKNSREEKYVPNKPIKASVSTNSITVLQLHVITKKDVNSDLNSLSSTGVNITTKTKRPHPRSNTKNDRVPSVPKDSWIKNNEVEVEEHHKNVSLSKNKKHMSYECNNVKLAIQNDKYEVVCAMCCFKHMTRNLKLLINFVWMFLGIVRFGNDHVATILEMISLPVFQNSNIIKNVFIPHVSKENAKRVYNRKTKKIIETINVTFDELLAMDFEQSSLKLGLQSMTFEQISSGLDLTYAPFRVDAAKDFKEIHQVIKTIGERLSAAKSS